ncbi:MAG: hypothetical protein QOE62_2581, partial [Actinomycetota bacterium]|nr:hypothetical protein [Actinomycetota bacterium]
SARDSVGRAVSVANDPGAARFRTQIISAAHQSFIGGMHLASVIAALIVLVAVAGVLIWLPARAIEVVDATGAPQPDSEPLAAAVGTT